MQTAIVFYFFITWIPAGFVAAGFGNATIQRAYPLVRSNRDLPTSLFVACACGWGALLYELYEGVKTGFKYGWSLKCDAVKSWKR